MAQIDGLTATEKVVVEPGMGGFEEGTEVQNDGSEMQNECQRAESLGFTDK